VVQFGTRLRGYIKRALLTIGIFQKMTEPALHPCRYLNLH